MITESVVRKANQIVLNLLAFKPEEEAIAAAAVHMRSYWPPTERAELFRLVDTGDGRLSAGSVAAAELLRKE